MNGLLGVVLLYLRHLETLGAEGQVDRILTFDGLHRTVNDLTVRFRIAVVHALDDVLALRLSNYITNRISAAVGTLLVGHDHLRHTAQRSLRQTNQLTRFSGINHIVRFYLRERHIE